MNDIKTVSIVMCTYNGEKFLQEQIDSIIRQTYPIHELIVQDDCSTDKTVDIIKEYTVNYPFIKLYINERNMGYNRNFHSVLRKAQGEFIFISDQDDVWSPDKLETMINCIGNHSLCFSHSASYNFFEEGNIPSPSPISYAPERLLFTNAISGHTMLLKREFVQQITYWNYQMYYDWWLAINACLADGIIECQETLAWHRVHESSAIEMQKATDAKQAKSNLSPYIKGVIHYRRLQKKSKWKECFGYIYKQAACNPQCDILMQLAGLMLSKSLFSLFKLCNQCMKRRKQIYPYTQNNKLLAQIRGFCFPLFYAYNNHLFD